MFLILLAVSILVLSGLLALFLGRQARRATVIGVGGAVLGCLIGLVPTVSVLWTGRVETWRGAWQVPLGSFFVQLDALSAFFLLPILGLSAVAALYGGEYLMAYRSRKNLGASWFFFNLLVASMVMVALARNGVLFLLAWEIMSLASFFLVTFEDEKESVRQAGWTYLVATHLGTAFLLVLFLVLGRQAGSLDFDRFLAASGVDIPGGGRGIFSGLDRLRNQGRFHAAARLAARGASGGAQPRFRPHVGRHDQDRHLRPAANLDLSGPA